MSIEKEERGKAFRKWKRDLDSKCDACMESLASGADNGPPEGTGVDAQQLAPDTTMLAEGIVLPVENLYQTIDPSQLGKIEKGEIKESKLYPGSWYVYANGRLIKMFQAYDAQRQAAKYVDDLLNS
jgi:hypothetical protein